MRNNYFWIAALVGTILGFSVIHSPEVGPPINLEPLPVNTMSIDEMKLIALERCELDRESARDEYVKNPGIHTTRVWMRTEQRCLEMKKRYQKED